MFTPLQSVKWKFNNTEQIAYSSYTIAAQTVVTLTAANNTLINDPFFQAVVEMIYYHNNLDRGAALVSQNYIDLNLVILFKGAYCRLIGFNLTTRTITLDYSTIGQTTSAGNIEVYPYRLPQTNVDYLTKIQIRKLTEETTFASGYNAGLNLEHRQQSHKHEFYDQGIFSGNGGGQNSYNSVYGSNIRDLSNANIIRLPISDGINGTILKGKTNRSNQSQSKLYLWAETYNA
ncbi:MAG: hypothetical protein IPL26_00115 [Leptospiraceae bacterium]|nr:hypothetical protein [Leptospiraceae bacterium]